MVMSHAGLGSVNDCAGEAQEQLYTTDVSSRHRGHYIRTTTATVQLEKRITGRGSQGSCRQDELTGDIPPWYSNSDSDSDSMCYVTSISRFCKAIARYALSHWSVYMRDLLT
jgi:hypothetical protein